MRVLLAFLMVCGFIMSMNIAQADPLSGAELKEKLSNTTLILSKSGRKTKRRMEVTLRKNGTGGSLHVPSGQILPIAWKVKGRDLCVTQKDGKEFCMATDIDGEKILVQMRTGNGKLRQLKGTVFPF